MIKITKIVNINNQNIIILKFELLTLYFIFMVNRYKENMIEQF